MYCIYSNPVADLYPSRTRYYIKNYIILDTYTYTTLVSLF